MGILRNSLCPSKIGILEIILSRNIFFFLAISLCLKHSHYLSWTLVVEADLLEENHYLV